MLPPPQHTCMRTPRAQCVATVTAWPWAVRRKKPRRAATGGEDKLIFLCGAKAEWAMARKSLPWHAPLRPLPVPTAMCAQRELKIDFK